MKPWWLNGPTATCARCGQPCYSKATPAMHRRCKPRAAPRPPTSHQERKRRAAYLQAWRAQFGDWCPGWGRPGHWATPPGGRNPLCADHVHSVAQGGAEDGELQALCNVCNSSKRERSGTVRTPARSTSDEPTYSPSRMWTSTYTPSGTC